MRTNRLAWGLAAVQAAVVLGGWSPSDSGSPARVKQGPAKVDQQRAKPGSVTLEVSRKEARASRFVLNLVLTYRGVRELRIYEANLPWRHRYSLMLVGVRADIDGTPLEKSRPIDDPGPGIVTLKPGQVLRGEVDLTDRFRDLAEVNRQLDVIIFWSYQLRPLQGGALPRVGGWVLIPKG